jgi:hypothetical protein
MSFQVLRALEGRNESIALTMPRMGLKKDRGRLPQTEQLRLAHQGLSTILRVAT